MTRYCALPALMLLLAGGCVHSGTPSDPPQWCTPDAEHGREVTIEVRVALGEPEPIVVTPSDCRVRPGALVRWSATGPDRDRFLRVEFKAESAAASGKREIPAHAEGGTKQALLTARWVGKEARFPYAVYAGDAVLDPDIIIDPARAQQ